MINFQGGRSSAAPQFGSESSVLGPRGGASGLRGRLVGNYLLEILPEARIPPDPNAHSDSSPKQDFKPHHGLTLGRFRTTKQKRITCQRYVCSRRGAVDITVPVRLGHGDFSTEAAAAPRAAPSNFGTFNGETFQMRNLLIAEPSNCGTIICGNFQVRNLAITERFSCTRG